MASGLGMGLPQFSERNCGTTAATRGVVPQLPQSCRTPSLPRKGEGVRRPLRQGFLVGLARQGIGGESDQEICRPKMGIDGWPL